MSRVSYQAMLGPEDEGGTPRYLPLDPGAIHTRRKEARAELAVRLSRDQLRWLKEIERLAGDGVDASAIVRALVDLGRELDVDWALVRKGPELRSAVQRSVLVRREPGAPGTPAGQ